MKLQRNRKRKARISVPIGSMGDIAFLLIIFFVLVSNFREAQIKADPPTSPDIEQLRETPRVSVIVDEHGDVYLDGERVAVGMLESDVDARLRGADDRRVWLRVHKDIPQSTFGPVLTEISRAEADPVMVGDPAETEE